MYDDIDWQELAVLKLVQHYPFYIYIKFNYQQWLFLSEQISSDFYLIFTLILYTVKTLFEYKNNNLF